MTIEAPAVSRPIGNRYDRTFYTGMAIVAAVVVLAGFAPTFYLRGSDQSIPLPRYLQIHGVLFTTWIALFVAQTSLVAARRTKIHRRLGWATALLAMVMVVVGTTAGILSMRLQVRAGNVHEAQAFLTTPLFSMVVFATLVLAAIKLRRDSRMHKRLMLLATFSILDAAIARLPFELLRSSWGFLPATDLLIAGAILYDAVTRRTVHQAYLWGGLLIVVGQALRAPIGETAAWQTIASAILK